MKRFSIVVLAAAGLVACELPTEQTAARIEVEPSLSIVGDVTVTDLGTLGGTFVQARAMNDAGQVIGTSTTASGQTHAFLWDGTMHDLGTLGGVGSSAVAISEAGHVVGVSTNASGEQRAFLWDGTMHDLGTLGGDFSAASDVNVHGHVAGSSTTGTGEQHAFLWDGTMHDLGTPGFRSFSIALNDVDQVTGIDQAPGLGGVVWSSGGVTALGEPGFTGTWPTDINNSGQVTGHTSILPSQDFRAFLWDGSIQDLGPFGGSDLIQGEAINDAGQILGRLNVGGPYHAFLWDGSFQDLGTLGGLETLPSALNDLGQVVGWSGFAGGGGSAFYWDDGTMVPMDGLDGRSATPTDLNNVGEAVGNGLNAAGQRRAMIWTVALRPATPAEETEILQGEVTDLIDAGTLPANGTGTALQNVLTNVDRLLEQGNDASAANLLSVFIRRIEALIANGTLTIEEGQLLIDAAQAAIDQL